jgi:predicted alpha/beta superfamily hydrolase
MKRITFAIIGLILSTVPTLQSEAQNTVLMQIVQLPAYHPSGGDIYIAGSFNGWNPHDDNYKFIYDGFGHYYFNLALPAGEYQYKVTRGGWDKGECKTGGTNSSNRNLKIPADSVNLIVIEDWADRYPSKPKASTASRNVHIVDTAFLIPQLNRARKIWIYLPENYSKDLITRYPVLYMQDGQNIFDDSTAYAGEWGIDEYMDHLNDKQCIIVAVDHGGEKRMTEYNPYDNPKFGKGEGKKYVNFLVNTLKPFIDKNYRTLSEKEHTLIAGSSMGGLISMYAVLQYPEVFGGAGVFSPSFWITEGKIFTDIKKKGRMVNSFIYMYGGKQEGGQMVVDILKAIETFPRSSKVKIVSVIREEGQHNEARWRLEFPLFYRGVLGDGQMPQSTIPSYWLRH